MDFAFSSVCRSLAIVLMSGFGWPAFTTMPMNDSPSGIRLSARASLRASSMSAPWPSMMTTSASSAALALHIHLQRGDERLLRDVDLAVLAHALLAFFLLLQKLALAGGVAAVAFGGHVLAECAHGLARDHLAADRRLDRHLEHVRGNQFFQFLRHRAAARLRAGAVDQHGERVDRLAVDQHLAFSEIGRVLVGQGIVERGIAARDPIHPR